MVVERMREIRPDLDEPRVVCRYATSRRYGERCIPPSSGGLGRWWLRGGGWGGLEQLVIEWVVGGEDGLEIIWHDYGWRELTASLLPDPIGAELQELEAEETSRTSPRSRPQAGR